MPDAAAWFCSMTADFERGARVLVDDAERHGKTFVRQFDQHCGNAAVLGIVDEHGRIVAFDDLERQSFDIQSDALRAPREQHLLASLQPELLFSGELALSEAGEDVVIVDDAVLVDFDEARAAMCMRGLEHVGQVLVHVDPARNEPRAGAEREQSGRHRPID